MKGVLKTVTLLKTIKLPSSNLYKRIRYEVFAFVISGVIIALPRSYAIWILPTGAFCCHGNIIGIRIHLLEQGI